MRSIRLVAAALFAASTLMACSGDAITSPNQRISNSAHHDDVICRSGYIAQSGRCE